MLRSEEARSLGVAIGQNLRSHAEAGTLDEGKMLKAGGAIDLAESARVLAERVLETGIETLTGDSDGWELREAFEFLELLQRGLAGCREPLPRWAVPARNVPLSHVLGEEIERVRSHARPVPVRYAAGYQAGFKAVAEIMDHRRAALIAHGPDHRPTVDPPEGANSSPFSLEKFGDVTLNADPPLDRERREAATEAAARIVAGCARTTTAVALQVARQDLRLSSCWQGLWLAECRAVENELNATRRQLRQSWDKLRLTAPQLLWRTRLAGELRGLADTIAAGARGGNEDFLAGFTSASRNAVRTLTAHAEALDVPLKLFSIRGMVHPLKDDERIGRSAIMDRRQRLRDRALKPPENAANAVPIDDGTIDGGEGKAGRASDR